MPLPKAWKLDGDAIESGQAHVFPVVREGDDRRFALKRLKNPSRRDRFAREVRAMQRLHNEGVTAIPEIITADLRADRPYFVMRWLDGSLQQRIESGEVFNRPEAAVSLVIEIAEALAAIHDRAVAHRDIKPSNILFDDGRVVLTDFGLCLEVAEPGHRLTEQSEAVGSRLYTAPENEGGLNDEIDQRPADFYAFGKVLWAVLAGRSPPPREQQLLPPNRLTDVLGDPRYTPVQNLEADLLIVDPRVRLDDWAIVIPELGSFDRLLAGAAAPDEAPPAPSPDARRAVHRIRDLPEVKARREWRDSTERERLWVIELEEVTEAALRDVAEEQLNVLATESSGELRLAISAWSHDLSQVLAVQPLLCPSEDFDPARPLLRRVSQPREALTGVSAGSTHAGPYLVLNLYASLQASGLWLIRLPYIFDPLMAPEGLVRRGFDAVGPLPPYLQQTLDAAARLGADAGRAFLQMLPMFLDALSRGVDPASEKLWAVKKHRSAEPGSHADETDSQV